MSSTSATSNALRCIKNCERDFSIGWVILALFVYSFSVLFRFFSLFFCFVLLQIWIAFVQTEITSKAISVYRYDWSYVFVLFMCTYGVKLTRINMTPICTPIAYMSHCVCIYILFTRCTRIAILFRLGCHINQLGNILASINQNILAESVKWINETVEINWCKTIKVLNRNIS